MSNKSKIFVSFIAVITVTIISCGKSATVDRTPPSVTITSPAEGTDFMQMGSSIDSITVSAHLTDIDLHAYSILVAKFDNSDTLLYVPETHQEVTDLTVTKKFPYHIVTGHNDYIITVKAEDHNGNEGEDIVNISVTHM